MHNINGLNKTLQNITINLFICRNIK